MARYRWYRIEVPIGLSALMQRVAAVPLLPTAKKGLVVQSQSGKCQNLRFAWRSDLTVNSIEEDGSASHRIIQTVNYCEIALLSLFGKLWLRIVDPPRSVKELLDYLESLVGFGFSVEPVVFGEEAHFELVRKVDDCRLVSFKGVGGIPSKRAVARIEMASKEGLELDGFDFLRNMNYTVDYALYEVMYKRERGQIAFSSTGQVRIGGTLRPYLLEVIESTLGAGG